MSERSHCIIHLYEVQEQVKPSMVLELKIVVNPAEGQ